MSLQVLCFAVVGRPCVARRSGCACWCVDLVSSVCRRCRVGLLPRGGPTACVRVQTLLVAAALGPGALGHTPVSCNSSSLRCPSVRPGVKPWPGCRGPTCPGGQTQAGAGRVPPRCPDSGGEQLRTPGHPCLHPRVPSLRLGRTSLWSPRRAAPEAHLLRRLAASADVFIHASDDSWSAGPVVLYTQAGKAGRPASQGRGDTVRAGQPLPSETFRPSVSLHCPCASQPASGLSAGPSPTPRPACRFSPVPSFTVSPVSLPEPLRFIGDNVCISDVRIWFFKRISEQ